MPEEKQPIVTITLQRDALAALASQLRRPTVKNAMGVRLDHGSLSGGSTNTAIQRAVGAVERAEVAAQIVDAKRQNAAS